MYKYYTRPRLSDCAILKVCAFETASTVVHEKAREATDAVIVSEVGCGVL